jgi:hypothetical protein
LDLILLAAILVLACCLGVLAMTIKLYTEFIKEFKYREKKLWT